MTSSAILLFPFFFNDTATTEIYTLSLHDALPISDGDQGSGELRPHAGDDRLERDDLADLARRSGVGVISVGPRRRPARENQRNGEGAQPEAGVHAGRYRAAI